MWRKFTRALGEVWRLSEPGGGAYRPDLHYMRGPGPKWHAKYGNLYPKAQPVHVPASSTVPNLIEHRA